MQSLQCTVWAGTKQERCSEAGTREAHVGSDGTFLPLYTFHGRCREGRVWRKQWRVARRPITARPRAMHR